MSLFTNKQILDIFEICNPWWKKIDNSTFHNYKNKRFSYYEANKILLTNTERKFILFNGLRRTGKTTILHQLIADLIKTGVKPQRILYFAFDHPIIKISGIKNVIKAYCDIYPIQNDIKKGEKVYFFIDEIQYAEESSVLLQEIYNEYPNIQVICSSSASFEREFHKSNNKLSFLEVLNVPPLNFYEYCNFIDLEKPKKIENLKFEDLVEFSSEDWFKLTKDFSQIVSHFKRYLILGGFPEFAKQSNDPDSINLLRSDAINKIIKPDLHSLYNIRNITLVEKVFLYLCINSGKTINAEKMSQRLDKMNKISMSNYIQFLLSANITYNSEPILFNRQEIYKSRPKIYISDAVIRNAVLFTDKTEPSDEELDRLVEALVYRHILSIFETNAKQIGYHRKPIGNKTEIDIVVDTEDSFHIFDVQYVNEPKLESNDAFFEIANSKNYNIKSAYMITKNINDYGLWDKKTNIPIIKIPAPIFLYLLGKFAFDSSVN
ncbi:MAG: ATP-binding protein [Treponema sp.]|nr:ATP-binding protein [Treponema sp.]